MFTAVSRALALCYCYNGEASEVGVNDDGLRVCITDDSYSDISFKLIQFIFKLGSEISALQVMNGSGKHALFCIIRGKSAPLSS